MKEEQEKNKLEKDLIEFIGGQVASLLKMDIDFLVSKTQKREAVNARQLAFKLCREYSKASYELIGEFFNRDHATVLHGVREIERIIDTEKKYFAHYEALKVIIKPQLDIKMNPEALKRYKQASLLQGARSACKRHKIPYSLRHEN